jgi:hypothetical protein
VLVRQAGGAVGGGVRVGEGAAAGVPPGAARAGLELAVTALEPGAVVVELLDDAQPTAAAMQTSAATAASGPAGLPVPGFPVLGLTAYDFTAVPSLASTPHAAPGPGASPRGNSAANHKTAPARVGFHPVTAGHAIGFANPAIYQRYGTKAFNDVTDHPLGPLLHLAE